MSISNEEVLIRALVDDIYQTEEKINLLNESLNKDNGQSTIFQRIENLRALKNNLIQQKLNLNNSFLIESKNNNELIQEKFNKIKDIENNLELKKNELIDFNVLSFNNLLLKKYILSNKSNDFLSEEQINDIIFDEESISSNSEIQKLKREIEINKASECVVINNYNEINSKISQIKENLKMLKEEKNKVKNELVNLISCKETLEQIIKLNINGLNILNKIIQNKDNYQKNKDNKESNVMNNKWEKPINLYIYELNVVNIKKAANNICNELFNLFGLDNNGKKNSHKDKDKNDMIIEYNNRNDNNYNIYSYNTCDAHHYNNDMNLYNNLNEHDNYFNNFLKMNLNLNAFTLNKKSLILLIQNEIEKFITGKVYSYKTIPEFLENLSILIVTKFQYIDIIISADSLVIYLSHFFKSLYYEYIINVNIKFINKDYKSMKKEYIKLIPYLQSESSKLDTKYNEYKSKTKIIEKQIKLIQKEYLNNKKREPITLSLEEQNYIQICSKANSLLKQKNSIQEKIKEYEEKNNKLKNENELKIKKINKEIINIDTQITKINEDIKNKKDITNENIDYYQKLIQEKYNVIKKQLQIYKNKYGSNLDIYNRLINSINDTIKKTYDKPPLIIINNNNNINNSHIFNNEIGKIIQNYSGKSKNKNFKEILLSQNDNDISITDFLNEAKNIKINNNISNSNKELFNFEFDISTIDKSPYELNQIKDLNNVSINNASTYVKLDNEPFMSIRERNIRKINARRKLNKALSNVSYLFDSSNKNNNPSINYPLKKNYRANKNSLNYTLRENSKNKTFYHSSLYNNISTKRGSKDIITNFTHKGNNSMANMNLNRNNNKNSNSVNIRNNLNYLRVKKFHKYNKSFNNNHNYKNKFNSLKSKSEILNFNNSLKNNKFQSFSFINNRQLDFKIKNNKISKILDNSINSNHEVIKSNSQQHSNNLSKIKINNYKNISNIIKNNNDIMSENNKFKFSAIKLNLREKISHRNFIQKMITEKIKPLTKMIFCYYRIYNNKLHKYNPLFNFPSEILCKPPYNFSNATISLTKLYDKLRITPIEKINRIDFKISDIENTIVNSKIKLIIEVHRNYRKFKEISNNKSMEDFIITQKRKYSQLTGEEIEKCAKNKNFNFSLIVDGGKVIELIICTYQEFKIWINGLAFLIKNKKEIMHYIRKNKKNL